MADSVAYRQSNVTLQGTFIPIYSSVALGLSFTGVTGDNFPNFSGEYGNTTWKNGISIGGTFVGSLGATAHYVIYSDEYSQGITGTPSGALPLAWAVTGPSQNDIRDKINDLPEMSPIAKHSTYNDAIDWLIGQGKYLPVNKNYPQIGYRYDSIPMSSAYDPTFMASYPFYSKDVYDLTNNSYPAELVGGTTWDSVSKNAFSLAPNTDSYIALRSTVLDSLSNLDGITISIWFNLQSLPSASNCCTLLFLQDQLAGDSNDPQHSSYTWMRIFIDDGGKIGFEGDPKLSGDPCPPYAILFDATSNVGSWVSLIFSVTADGDINVYINGEQKPSLNYNFIPGMYNTTFGTDSPVTCSLGSQLNSANPTFPSDYRNNTGFNGKIGSLHIYNGILNDTEMIDLYHKTNGFY